LRPPTQAVALTIASVAEVSDPDRCAFLRRQPENKTGGIMHMRVDDVEPVLAQQTPKAHRKTVIQSNQMDFAAERADLIIQLSGKARERAEMQPVAIATEVPHEVERAHFGAAALHATKNVEDIDSARHQLSQRPPEKLFKVLLFFGFR
jgi:hypothetical protein